MAFKGIITALVTPFKSGEVDYQSLKKLLRDQLDNSIDGLVISGTTGESPTLTAKEKEKILLFVKAEVAGQVPIIIGTGSNNTVESVEVTKAAERLGVDGALVVVPYYNKPPQEGLYRHFEKIAASTKLPVILYNVPSRTITALSLETICRLAEVDNVVGIKEASGNIEFGRDIVNKTPQDFFVLSGDDGTYLDLYGVGAEGVISVISNIIPAKTKKWAASYDKSETKNDFKSHKGFIDTLFAEANPIPIKMALYWKGLISSPEMRLPLVSLSESAQKRLRSEMERVGML